MTTADTTKALYELAFRAFQAYSEAHARTERAIFLGEPVERLRAERERAGKAYREARETARAADARAARALRA